MKKGSADKLKIISGGQTGVDRAALDAALRAGAACGGWCPEGRKAEDGPIADRYPLKELPGGGYRQRTLKNIEAGDATLIVYFATLSGGTELTLAGCINRGRPYLLLDGLEVSVERAVIRTLQFVVEKGVTVLNVAGPRASGDARGYAYTFELISALLDQFRRRP